MVDEVVHKVVGGREEEKSSASNWLSASLGCGRGILKATLHSSSEMIQGHVGDDRGLKREISTLASLESSSVGVFDGSRQR